MKLSKRPFYILLVNSGLVSLHFWFSMVFFMLILQVFYGNMDQKDDGGDFSCASFVCLDEDAWIRST
ncbi:unnamed protein product [Prunus armeniaca]